MSITESEAIEILSTFPPKDKMYNTAQVAIKALKEIQQYKTLGIVEELRIAKEKQIPKKPVMKPYFEDMEEEYLCCPTCGEILTDRIPNENKNFYFHCLKCGQAFDWSDEESEFYIEALLVSDPRNSIGFYDKEFGKTVFLTQEEAEQKLKEMESD